MDWDYSRHYARFHPDTPAHNANLDRLLQRWLGAALPADKNAAVLDVGCGRGYALGWLRRQGFTRLAGIDPDNGQVAFARNLGLDVQRVADSSAHLRSHAGEFDLILLMDVLEHVPYEAQGPLMQAMQGALRPGGKLICTVPNADSPLASRWRHVDYTHQLLFTMESLEFLLSQTGFRVEKITAAEFAEPARFFLPLNRRWLRWCLLHLSRLHPRLLQIGELGWKEGWRIPLSPNLLAIATRD